MEFDDDYFLNDISDEERGADSSDEDEATMAQFNKLQTKKVQRKQMADFEAEMEAELNKRADDLQSDQGYSLPELSGEKKVEKTNEQSKFYDDVYFDSDSEDDKSDTKRQVQSDLDLLYDPEQDSADQAWVDKQRAKANKNVKKLPNSDAVLNCPACFSLLCLDCQRHETYKTQYRAMFVFNCTVDESKTMRYPNAPVSSKKKKMKLAEEKNYHEEVYHPVTCSVCTTNVAVYDREEVYHFFNVMSSH